MRLLLSICLLLASVVSGRAQGLTWPTPGSPVLGGAFHDSYAANDDASSKPARGQETSSRDTGPGEASAATTGGDRGNARTAWLAAGPETPREQLRSVVDPSGGRRVPAAIVPYDDRRAIRVFRRAMTPPDDASPTLSLVG